MNKEVRDKIKSLRELGGNLCILRERLKKESKIYMITTNSVTLKVRECLESAIDGLNIVVRNIEEGIVGIVYQEFLDEEDLENGVNFEEIDIEPVVEGEITSTHDFSPTGESSPGYDADGFYTEEW